MLCPVCGAEYREGFVECSDCGVALVSELPPPPAEEEASGDLETVLETVNPALIAIAKSLLENAGIPYLTANEGSQIEFTVIPVRIRVERERAEEARALLEDLKEGRGLAEEYDDGEE